ncbi:MAG: uncharacterized protein JWL61_3707 [Gemmatimonadetes bacterium]|nr:uncharacterized protein [Gemmatimonadota bacterium]
MAPGVRGIRSVLMPELLHHGRPVETFFDLLGDDENDMSAALGYALARSSVFLGSVVADILEGSPPVGLHQAIVTLQTTRGQGITDVELRIGDHTHLILEAKRGPVLPTEAQLSKYAPVLAGSGARTRALVTVTNVSPQAAAVSGFPKEILGIPVVHRSWRRLRELAVQTRPAETNAAKQLLDQFTTYLGAILGMENRYSNMVYVVSLGPDLPSGWTLSWRDIVRERGRYFYPVGKHWPEPPNYIAFRYDGRLQHLHHVQSLEGSRTRAQSSRRRPTPRGSRITAWNSARPSRPLARSRMVHASCGTTESGA